ncbi:MAG: hypothetical protein BIFFINMI_00657 [Phycisphaerae bacterium]|nr:hypothetical protein [Phycisphaerae bacterium]
MSNTKTTNPMNAAYDAMVAKMTTLGQDLIDHAAALKLARESGMAIDGKDVRAMHAKMTKLAAAVSAATANPWR